MPEPDPSGPRGQYTASPQMAPRDAAVELRDKLQGDPSDPINNAEIVELRRMAGELGA